MSTTVHQHPPDGRSSPPDVRPARILQGLVASSLLGLLGLLVAVPAATAQTVYGEVLDADERPLSEVYVALLDRNRVSVATAVTNRNGEFEIRAPIEGSYFLYVNRIGYHSLNDGPYPLRQGRPLEVWVVMHPDPVRLEGVTGTAESRVQRLAAVGFYERQEAGFGHFIEREEFERKAVRHVTDALRALPRVRVAEPAPTFGGPGDLLNPQLQFRLGGRLCSPTLLIDGGEVHRGGYASDALRPDDWLIPHDVEAMEVYTGASSLPLQYAGMAPCGLIMVWTKHTPAIGR